MKPDNSKKIILDLCGGTGSWSKPYKDAGYDVRVITLPNWSVIDVEFYPEQEYLVFISLTGEEMRIDYKDIYGILAAPPCTMFSMVRTTPKKPRDFEEGMVIVEKCLEIIWTIRKHHKIFWAMENPRGYLQQFIGRPCFEFDPTEYGDPHNKKTQIWGFFEKPVKTHQFKKTKSHAISNDHFQPLPVDYVRDPNMRLDAIKRSITPQGFARAFYRSNK